MCFPPTQFTSPINNLPTYSHVYKTYANFLFRSLLSTFANILSREDFFLYFDNGIQLIDKTVGRQENIPTK